MEVAYVLSFMYDYEVDEDLKMDHAAWLGIFSSYKKAQEALAFYRALKEYEKFPEECFYIGKYPLNKKHWTTGFV
jgi:hypothetical protein